MHKEPIYRKIMTDIESMIESGEFSYGAKLPTEREIAAKFSVARGTVKKAFSELEKASVINIVWGSGAYVIKKSSDKSESPESKLGEAFFAALAERGFSPKEAWEYTEISYSKAFRTGNVLLALVDECHECLRIFSHQLESLKGVKVSHFLMEDLAKSKYNALIFKEFDIILANKDVSQALCNILPKFKDKIQEISSAPTQETQIDLLKIMNFEKTGLFSESRAFRDIVNAHLESKGWRYGEKDHIFAKWTGRDEFDEFIADKRHLIIPPFYSMDIQPEVYESLFEFLRRGGDIIVFNHTIERSSILYIEERLIKALYNPDS
ncbi:MAG: GntR family transcriptional regulator [Defluviitaleaceae bacterium]|nr:GntR family transcriptional regulator [Defluviitaleaceae bacterium]